MTRAVLAIASARSAARPSQNMASAARVGTDEREVDLRQRRRHDHRRGAVGAEHPDVLGQAGRRPAGVVARREHPPVAAGHHGDAVGPGDGVQPDDDGAVPTCAVAERRHGAPARVARRRRAGAASATSR